MPNPNVIHIAQAQETPEIKQEEPKKQEARQSTSEPKKSVKYDILPACEAIRPVVEKYFGEYTELALFISTKEAGCRPQAVGAKNRNGTTDYCAFQINNEPATRDNLDLCVKRAWEKFKGAKYTARPWYSVCDINRKPKYSGIICK